MVLFSNKFLLASESDKIQFHRDANFTHKKKKNQSKQTINFEFSKVFYIPFNQIFSY